MRQNSSAQLDVRALHAAVRSDRLAKQAANEERITRAKQAAVERNVVGEATDALGLRRARKWKASGADLIEPMQLDVPISRKLPLYSDNGLRSFHLAWQPIAKTLKRRSLANGTVLSPGAAAENVRYIAAAHEPAGEASAHVQYLDGDRVHRDENGDKLFLTNIAPNDLPECVRFFERVEDHEQKPTPDALEVWFDKDVQLWRSVTNDPDCDPALAVAWAQWRKQHLDELARGTLMESAKLDISLSGSADDLEELLERHGRAPLGDKKKADCHQQDGYYLRRGRGGRVQHRVNGSLPSRMPDPQKREVLRRIVERLGGMGGMYLAVLHEPDHANDPDHHHFHVAIYDRPCRRFTNQAAEADRITSRGDKKLVEDDLKSGVFSPYEGEWDFTVRRVYKTSSRNRRVHYPFRQKKAEAFRPYGTIRKFRKFVAETVNAVSVENAGEPIYDPGRYSEMGIDKEADERLQPRGHQREVKGYATTKGIDNERKQAEACRREIERCYRKELEAIEASARNLLSLEERAGPSGSMITLDLKLNLAEQAMVVEARKELALLDLECERELSRPRTVSATAMRRLPTLGKRAQRGEMQRIMSAHQQIAEWARVNSDCMARADELRYALQPRQFELAFEHTELEGRLLAVVDAAQKRSWPAGNLPPPSAPMASVPSPSGEEIARQLVPHVEEAGSTGNQLGPVLGSGKEVGASDQASVPVSSTDVLGNSSQPSEVETKKTINPPESPPADDARCADLALSEARSPAGTAPQLPTPLEARDTIGMEDAVSGRLTDAEVTTELTVSASTASRANASAGTAAVRSAATFSLGAEPGSGSRADPTAAKEAMLQEQAKELGAVHGAQADHAGGELLTQAAVDPSSAGKDKSTEPMPEVNKQLRSGSAATVPATPRNNIMRRRSLASMSTPSFDEAEVPSAPPRQIEKAAAPDALVAASSDDAPYDQSTHGDHASDLGAAAGVVARLSSLLAKHAPPRPSAKPITIVGPPAPDAATLDILGKEVRQTLDRVRHGQLRLVERQGRLVPAPSHAHSPSIGSIVRVYQQEIRKAHEHAKAEFGQVFTFLQSHGLKVARREEPISQEMMVLLRRWRRDPRLRKTLSQLRDEALSAGRLRRSAQRPTPTVDALTRQIAASQSSAEQHSR
ncbi:hypothetical protein [Sphingomonas sp. LHG3443-2]|uniref:hypothetical protein n=1 Tax=Sphingomonas sp. LHG3443-2 TaxID=2804639 RepID=UPI003CF36A23